MSTETKFFLGVGIITLIIIIVGVLFLGNKNPKQQEFQSTVDQNILLANTRNSIGDPNAPIKIVEFADLQCSACAVAEPIIKEVIEKNKDKVYFVYRHYPLSNHKNSRLAAKATESAASQGKFWEMQDLIFKNQSEWAEGPKAQEIFENYSKQLGLDVEKFKQDLDKFNNQINQDYADGNKLGVDSTPTFFINGQKSTGSMSYEQFQKLINQAATQ